MRQRHRKSWVLGASCWHGVCWQRYWKKWTVIESGRGASGRFGSHKVLREQPGPTPHATRSVSEEKVSSAWRLFIDDSILRQIKRCTEAEAATAGEQNLSLAIEELDAWCAVECKLGTSFFSLIPCLETDFVKYWSIWNLIWKEHVLSVCQVTNLQWLLKYGRSSLITAFSATDLDRILLQMSNCFHLKPGTDLPNTWRTNLTSLG